MQRCICHQHPWSCKGMERLMRKVQLLNMLGAFFLQYILVFLLASASVPIEANLPSWKRSPKNFASPHRSTAYPLYRMVARYISGLEQHTSFIGSQKFPQNPDRHCVQKETPELTILWFPLCKRSETHNTTVRGFYIFHTF